MVSSHLDDCLRIVESCTDGCSAASGSRRVGDRWSVAEIVEHLQRAYSGTAKGLERCLEKGAPLATTGTLKQKLQAFGLVTLGYFPPGRVAPKHIIPTGAVELPDAVNGVRKDLQRLDDAAVEARRAFGSVKVLDHPILGPFSVDQWLKFHLVHTKHHERQIRERR